MQAVLPSLEEKGSGLPLERGMQSGLPGVKEIFGLTLLLSKPATKEMLYLYLTISESTISRALVLEEEGAQKPVLCQSHYERPPDQIPKAGEASVGPLHHLEKT